MATIYDLKPKFQGLLRPIVKSLAKSGVTANAITMKAFIMSAGMGAGLAYYPGARGLLFLLPVFLLVRMAMNAVDGMLAREHDQKTKLGAILNETTDVLSDAALYLPFALIPGVDAIAIVTLVLLAIIGELVGVLGVMIGASRRYDGPFGKSDRAFFFGALALLLGFGVAPGMWMTAVLGGAILFAALTIVNRARAALKEAGDG
ncbi:MAG: CDP-alcohol phosphatidyltransferase family protein [Marinicaulis sp.]|nr:CDP-alcohol phosphatidyltransferase family protein [Marinicaulis sp.]NNE40525.1 CDP-alcohol phosphatidyltransferase family protein [Marinicaulis sp.]NNL87795.1 CDP-alcohol phosphatidyltransferase family protein [Marinicaulis sp.]